ncbi:unnamed protein product [Cercopithifilaria johnstoni]|uniref:Uncharacterized protein n=1 Tax=Cercopithifilaria johnstoni TaxID=2874296 RepID=A0A8J2LUN6_9BILA|nr:unnamed protein product [Cercopithifilaria johnstoni]
MQRVKTKHAAGEEAPTKNFTAFNPIDDGIPKTYHYPSYSQEENAAANFYQLPVFSPDVSNQFAVPQPNNCDNVEFSKSDDILDISDLTPLQSHTISTSKGQANKDSKFGHASSDTRDDGSGPSSVIQQYQLSSQANKDSKFGHTSFDTREDDESGPSSVIQQNESCNGDLPANFDIFKNFDLALSDDDIQMYDHEWENNNELRRTYKELFNDFALHLP